MKSKEFKSNSFEKYFEEKMKNEDFRQRWEELQPEYQQMRSDTKEKQKAVTKLKQNHKF